MFAFAHLVPSCSPEGPLEHPAQVGIEVSVPQIAGPRRKRVVAKDLIIWPRPRMTCWDDEGRPSVAPMAILEWKTAGYPKLTSGSRNQREDRAWMSAWTEVHRSAIGFLVLLDFTPARTTLAVDRVHRGQIESGWLEMGTDQARNRSPA